MSTPRDNEYAISLARLGFYKKYFGIVLWTLLISLIANGFLSAGFIWVKNQKVEREYFAVDPQGHLTKIVPLGEPFIADQKLLGWARDCITAANTYNFAEYRDQFNRAKKCFTDDGWDQFVTAIDKAGSLERVKTQRLLATGVASGPGVITRKGLRSGIFTWKIQQPVVITYQGGPTGRTTITQNVLAEITVSRIPTFESEEGVGIAQYIGAEK